MTADNQISEEDEAKSDVLQAILYLCNKEGISVEDAVWILLHYGSISCKDEGMEYYLDGFFGRS